MTCRPKWQIALDLSERAVANGIRFEWVGANEGYGKVPEFLFHLDDRGQRYVVEVAANFTGWLIKPSIMHKEHHCRMGRKRRFPRLTAKSPPASSVKQLLLHSPVLRRTPWEKFYIKDTSKGPMLWQAKASRFYLKREGLPTRGHWLIMARNIENPKEIKYFVSNFPEGTPLEVLLHVAFSRWPVERCFEDEKNELGLSHFEVRNYKSLRRHLIITMVSHLFLAKVHQSWRGKKPELTVCQIRSASSALVRSLWLADRVKEKFLERTAEIITSTQVRIARSRRCHVRKKRRRLCEMGIDLRAIRCCILKT